MKSARLVNDLRRKLRRGLRAEKVPTRLSGNSILCAQNILPITPGALLRRIVTRLSRRRFGIQAPASAREWQHRTQLSSRYAEPAKNRWTMVALSITLNKNDKIGRATMGYGSRLKATPRWVRRPFSYLSSLTICAISPALAQTDVMARIATAAQTSPAVSDTGNLA